MPTIKDLKEAAEELGVDVEGQCIQVIRYRLPDGRVFFCREQKDIGRLQECVNRVVTLHQYLSWQKKGLAPTADRVSTTETAYFSSPLTLEQMEVLAASIDDEELKAKVERKNGQKRREKALKSITVQ